MPKLQIFKKIKVAGNSNYKFLAVFSNINQEDYCINFELKTNENSNINGQYYLYSEIIKKTYEGNLAELDSIDEILLKKIIYTTLYEIVNNTSLYIKQKLKGTNGFELYRDTNRQMKLALRKYKYNLEE